MKTAFLFAGASVGVAVHAVSFAGVKTNDDSCTVAESARSDCGYVGIDQMGCEQKGCCWSPDSGSDVPWCYYKGGDAPTCWKTSTSTDAPFTPDQVAKFTKYFENNININASGAVVAAPDYNTPGGSYYYHWERDGALTMRTLYDTQTDVDDKMQSYVKWVLKVQNQPDPNNIDIRTEPKYTIPDGVPYTGGWCRPQTDGPALRAAALIGYALDLLKAGKKDYVTEFLWTGSDDKNGGAIKYDLDWVVDNWNSNGCDLWEEVQSTSFFWNGINFKRAMQLGADLAHQMGDSASADKYHAAVSNIITNLDGHWTGTFLAEADNRPVDGAVFVALNDGFYEADGLYSPTSDKVASTIKTFIDKFCIEYPINQQDYKDGIAGILIGRYPGDTYGGGNPWVLTSGALATLFYRGATQVLNENGGVTEAAMVHWRQIFGIDAKANPEPVELAKLFVASADGVLERIAHHVSGDDFHMAEQIDKNTGKQTSAHDLTWSYAEVIKAMKTRESTMELLSIKAPKVASETA